LWVTSIGDIRPDSDGISFIGSGMKWVLTSLKLYDTNALRYGIVHTILARIMLPLRELKLQYEVKVMNTLLSRGFNPAETNVSRKGSDSAGRAAVGVIGRTGLAVSLLSLTLVAVRPAAGQNGTTFNGTLADEHLNCLQNPVKAVEGVTEKTSCMLYWAHHAQPASKYVLYDEATKTTYQLDNQDLVQPYVGAKRVQITGTLDAGTKTIKVTGIKVPDSQG
jgi:hypothetical protein